MRSAIVFRPGSVKNSQIQFDWALLLRTCAAIAEEKKHEVKIVMQHALDRDVLAILIEMPGQSFITYDQSPRKVLQQITLKLLDYLNHEQTGKAAKRFAGKKDGRRGRGPRTAGKRGSPVLQRGRPQGRRAKGRV